MDVKLTIWDLCSLLGVALVWGISNVFLKQGVTNAEPKNLENCSTLLKPLYELWYLVKNWRFMVPFAVNQLGSVAFYYLLSQLPLTLVVPVVNSLTLLVTALYGHFIGELLNSARLWFGAALIMIGVAICLNN